MEHHFGENVADAFRQIQAVVDEFHELYALERGMHDGEPWFVQPRLADLSDELARWLDTYAGVFRRSAERFRTGHE
ncbi:hypothetical protein ATK30_4789 [Amycolatopsis echigonensis]|uniref:Uncharacterized protein n=1 Tax=Amycolatopsis echigonensis TaxID=2576905 RepID=A0A2N3WJ84_9PSEU|nr:hypothetical protein [Amycolatopsis niigatensis]PKV93929.1 hypothetical protein ATK30_4789 [Amycolatopsis niigatensis]